MCFPSVYIHKVQIGTVTFYIHNTCTNFNLDRSFPVERWTEIKENLRKESTTESED